MRLGEEINNFSKWKGTQNNDGALSPLKKKEKKEKGMLLHKMIVNLNMFGAFMKYAIISNVNGSWCSCCHNGRR